MNLDPIREYIRERSFLAVGVNLFTYNMPADVHSGVLLINSPAGNSVDHEIDGVYKARFQIIVRHSDYDEGYKLAKELFTILNMDRVDLTEYIVDFCRPRNTPLPFPRSAGDKIEFSVNFDIRYRDP